MGIKDDLPNLLVIGAAKAGTTSLDVYLAEHPQISMAPKETQFFVRPDFRDALSEYTRNFTPADVRGETDGAYAAFPVFDGVPERIHSVIPDAKLIYLVRDPIERAVSHYHQRYIGRMEPRPISAAFSDVDDPFNRYVTFSRYALQIEQYMRHFPPESLYVLDSLDLRTDREAAMRRIFEFVGVDPDIATDRFSDELNVTAGKRRLSDRANRFRTSRLAAGARAVLPEAVTGPAGRAARRALSRPVPKSRLPEETRERLADALREDVARLRAFTGRDFASWSV